VPPVRLRSESPESTFSLGEKLGKLLKEGDVVCFYGEVGAGKTAMIKGIASAFGIDERDITSASFTIIAGYDTKPPFNHIDLYRLRGGEDVFETGIFDCLGKGNVSVIEWAERLTEVPKGAIRVKIEIVSEDMREISIEGIDEKDWNNL
jgi:tRNA threonylcarbamoyladenosine biosynthesis protein TsaE